MEILNDAKKKTVQVFLGVSLLAGVYACQPNNYNEDNDNEHAITNVDEDTYEYKEEAWGGEEQEEYFKPYVDLSAKVDQKVKEWEVDLNNRSGDERKEMQEKISSLHEKRQVLDTRMNEARNATKKNLAGVKSGIANAAKDLETSFNQIDDEFQDNY